MQVTVTGGTISEEEKRAYIQRANDRYGIGKVRELRIHVDGEYVELSYYPVDTVKVNFHRIRRITGYLVGDMDRWNNAKTAEERDRVKHL